MRLARLACGECGRRLAEIFDAPDGKVEVRFNNRRPTTDGTRFAATDDRLMLPDPSLASPSSTRSVTVHCYDHDRKPTDSNPYGSLTSTIRWRDLADLVTEARRRRGSLTMRCPMTTNNPDS